uniref:BTB domain-containing protein n=1 Tax=Anopheles arabiensis TaxID=7173 RepID=A0A182I443_ANOAR
MAQSSSGPTKTMLVWLDYSRHMLSTLQDIYADQQYTDCRLVVPDGELYANRPILSMASGLFEAIFTSMVTLTMDPSTVLIPDMTFANLQRVVQFIYTGRVTLQPDEVVPFMEACGLLQLRGVECCGNRTMGIYIDESGPEATAEDGDPFATAPETDPLHIDHTRYPGAVEKAEPPPLKLIEPNLESTSELFPGNICKEELMVSDEDSAEEEEEEEGDKSDAGEDSSMDDSTDSEQDVERWMALVKEVGVVDTSHPGAPNFTPYQNCLKQAIVAVISGNVSPRRAAARYNVPASRLVRWTQKVKRAMKKKPETVTANVSQMVAAYIDRSIQEFKQLLETSDADERVSLLSDPSNVLMYDVRIMLAIHDIMYTGISLREAVTRYKNSLGLLRNRLYNLKSQRITNHFKSFGIRLKSADKQTNERQAAGKKRRRFETESGKILKTADPSRYEESVAKALEAIGYVPKLVPFGSTGAVTTAERVRDRAGGGEIALAPASTAAPPIAAPSLLPLPKLVPISSSSLPEYEERMEAAIAMISNQKMSYREASVKYNIPKATLWKKISKMEPKNSCLTWLNFREHMLNTFCGIYRTQQHTDCRLIVPDGELYANRPILCMASSFLETILDGLPTIGADMVTIVIPDLTLATLRAVLQFIYTGEASVRSDEMASFVEACSFLQLRGVRFIANQIVGIRFGKTVGMVSEELIPASEAMDAILHHGISYRIAARQYSIAKTVLWRKAMKMPRPVRVGSPKLSAQRREAIDALKTGEKLAHVSRRFEIPLSTLHREKQRLYSKGALPSNVSLKLRGKDESVRKRLQEAVGDCVAGRMSLSEAARTYGLPKTSIWRRVRSLQTSGCSSSGMKEDNSASDAMAERPNQSEEAEVEVEEEEEEDDDAKLTMGGILLRGSDTLQ